ncbi:unnamed protein product [Owenia fusiformis]|uniref:Uncharacterized protein n=1 Tax=Owenia fusiformis TaxID=6347 RepID=A0A8J1UHL0_OWEFU|nr:unnamed protein product [Owenia fusiformis]
MKMWKQLFCALFAVVMVIDVTFAVKEKVPRSYIYADALKSGCDIKSMSKEEKQTVNGKLLVDLESVVQYCPGPAKHKRHKRDADESRMAVCSPACNWMLEYLEIKNPDTVVMI